MLQINKTILAVGMCLVALSCSKEEAITNPSLLDKNWYELQDSDDAVGHLAYTIYDEYSIPVFATDTIGSRQDGVDHSGNPVMYYEVLNANYSVGVYRETATPTVSTNEADIIEALTFMYRDVMPRMDMKVKPRCFLLVDEISVMRNVEYFRHTERTYRGNMVSLVGDISTISSLSEDERHLFASEIIANEWANYLWDNYYRELELFFKVSSEEVYSKSAYGLTSTAGASWSSIPYADIRVYGFLGYHADNLYTEGSKYTCPDYQMDLVDFLIQYFDKSEATFREENKDYEYVLKKYDYLKAAINAAK